MTNLSICQKKQSNKVPDSLSKISFTELEKRFFNSVLDGKKRTIYAKAYYNRSKHQNDKIIFLNGMYLSSYSAKTDALALKFADSIIELSKDLTDKDYPAKAYILKSKIFFSNDELKKSLVEILNAEKYSDMNSNSLQNASIKQQIGLIKVEMGKASEALPLILENYSLYKNKNINSVDFIYTSWILSDIYNRLNKPNEALKIINISLSLIDKENIYFKYLLLNKAISYNLLKKYKISTNILDVSIPLIIEKDDKLNLAIAYFYHGENDFFCDNNEDKAYNYFIKTDSVLLTTNEFSEVLRKNYVYLIQFSDKKNEIKKQLYFMNRLISIDEKLKNNNLILSTKITNEYDTPHLLKEKQKLIIKINNQKRNVIITSLIIFFCLVFSLYYLFKIRKEKIIFEKRFNDLISNSKTNEEIDINPNLGTNKNNNIVNQSAEVPIDILNNILESLKTFESNKEYLTINLKSSDLAQKCNTNTTYLSKVINNKKGKNFSQYINDLRIDFAIQKLKEDKNFRKYTIKAISEEVGFNNSESFAKAFNAKTGIQPSYFIKKINNI